MRSSGGTRYSGVCPLSARLTLAIARCSPTTPVPAIAAAELCGEPSTLGSDMNGWFWGVVHPASFPHPIWARLPLIARWLALAIPDDGSFDTIDNATFFVGDEAQPFTALHGPGLRMITDMANPDAARFIITPGQSGNILSPHYSDLMRTWRDVGYLTFSDDAGGGVLTLAPR